jgi:hypothetical protein
MASNKKGSHAGTDHLFGSYWKHLRKEGKQQFWKKERHLTELTIKKNEDKGKVGPVYEKKLSKSTSKRKREHEQILRKIRIRARERALGEDPEIKPSPIADMLYKLLQELKEQKQELEVVKKLNTEHTESIRKAVLAEAAEEIAKSNGLTAKTIEKLKKQILGQGSQR